MRPIVFVKANPNAGSAKTRGDQVANLLLSRGLDAKSVSLSQAKQMDLSESLVVVIKELIKEAFDLRAWKIIYDVVDNSSIIKQSNISIIPQEVDAIIFPNKRAYMDLGKAIDRPSYYIYHLSFNVIPIKSKIFSVAYCGAKEAFRSIDKLPGIVKNFYDPTMLENPKRLTAYLKTARQVACHLTFRDIPYKPPIKISFAAKCGSVIVGNRDSGGAEEFLGKGYPYLVQKYSIDDLADMIDKAAMTFQSSIWRRAEAAMEDVRQRSTDDRIIQDYIDFFEKVQG